MDMWIVNILNGISYSFILFLIAIGLSLILGVMGILNLSHGAFYLIGAYIMIEATACGINFGLAILAGAVVSGLLGLFAERLFLRHLHKLYNEQVLITLGLVYIFENISLWIWGPWPKMSSAPPSLSGSISIGDYSFPVYRFILIIIGIVIALSLYLLQEKTRYGAILRAGMDNNIMTIGLGINYGRIACSVFVLGIFIAGFAGAIASPMLGAYLGASMDMLQLALIVVVVGGMGTVQGTLIGALVIGMIDYFGKTFFPDFAMFTIYFALIVMLLIRPNGILGRKVV